MTDPYKWLRFQVPGPVKGAQRHRTQIRYQGGRPKVHMHRTESEISHSSDIKYCFLEAHPDHIPWEGPVELHIVARLLPPKNGHWPNRHCLKKPDWDNVAKLVGDALNRLAYRDDSQIFAGSVRKAWCEDGEIEGLTVSICLFEETPKPQRARKAAS